MPHPSQQSRGSENYHPGNPRIYDAIVVGLGGMGSAALLDLALRGLSVLGLEQFPLVHDRGSSHGQTRVIRTAYYEHPSYVPLVQRAFELWYRLERLSGKHLLTESDCLSLGLPAGELIGGVNQAAKDHSLSIDCLSASEVHKRFPAFEVPSDFVGVLEHQAGFLAVEECVRAAIEGAREHGAVVVPDEKVVSWNVDGNGVTVSTTHSRYFASRLILSAGPWAGQMLNNLKIPLTLMRQNLFWYGTSNDRLFGRNRFPVFMAETAEGFYYGVPMIDRLGPKVARHYGQPECSFPEEIDRTVTTADATPVRRFVDRFLPKMSGPLHRSETCIYTLTPDRNFILDHHPEYPQVVLAAGFSGHGFKFASVVGEILADLVETGQTQLDISRFRLSRFNNSNIKV